MKTEEITQRGNTLMSKKAQAPMLFVFQESEYQSRCNEAKVRYENTLETSVIAAQGAIVEFTPSSVESAFEDYHNYRVAGYAPLDSASPLPSISVISSPVTGALVVLYMLKPEALQEAELKTIYADVRAEYQAELDRELEAHIDRTVQSLIDAEDRAKAKAEAELLEKRQEEKRAEALAAREKLRAELIEAGKLNPDGSAA
ncbi:hypothetical protein KVQ82_23540 [Pseudomonas sp. AO-1]|uniref:hypothetical protein n=1 Tax=Pseudomonas sp. AO-1 TaxID=2855434 RepID=UPI001C745AFB|nr:hypothetical protein [Pseudomonas sp. AO-1]QXZ13023.1 hypothetical protein KVQ82_23540 [Pseudomonas sp. AO-1]